MPRLIGLLLAASVCLAGCDLSYYWQAAQGQMDLLQRREPITELVQQSETPAELKEKLQYVLRVREFASTQLNLEVDNNYASYADLERPFVVWNVFATQPLSMQNEHWCFPIAGCVPYRGYFAESAAYEFANDLASQGMDIYVGGVPAYSTLGWFDDAVLNTFIQRDALSLAGLLFHELAHHTFYIAGDSTFNESFASTVEDLGLERWIQHANLQQFQPGYALARQRQSQFLELVLENRAEREALFNSEQSAADKHAGKQALQNKLRHEYATLKSSWGGYSGYDGWFAGPLNNAQLSTVATYHQLEPGFRTLFEQSGQNFKLFFSRCRQLADRSLAERHLYLNQLANGEIVYTDK